jgi:hypothetical protein
LGRRNRCLVIARAQQPGQEAFDRPDRQLVQTRALLDEPLVEGRVAHAEAIEQRPLVEPLRPRQVAVGAIGGKLLELEHVDRYGAGFESYTFSIRHHDGGTVFLQPVAQRRKGLAQRILGLRLRPVTPE